MIDWENIVFPAASVIASSAIAVWQAKKTARSEIEKLQAVWAHERETACDADFDNMVATVSLYAKDPSPRAFIDATNAVGVYRAKAAGAVAEAVDVLSQRIIRYNPDKDAVLQQLDVVIKCKRGDRT